MLRGFQNLLSTQSTRTLATTAATLGCCHHDSGVFAAAVTNAEGPDAQPLKDVRTVAPPSPPTSPTSPLTTDYGFDVKATNVTFGRGTRFEVGGLVSRVVDAAGKKRAGKARVGVFTDKRVGGLEGTQDVVSALADAGLEVVLYDEVACEPTDGSFMAAGAWVGENKCDAYVSIGGGSVMDTAKAGMVYGFYPHPEGFFGYINKPLGVGDTPPGSLPPHIAIPTTSGTGSETTGFAICDVISLKAKTALASKALVPLHAVVDPAFCDSLTPEIICASGYDVLCHAMESYTARPYHMRATEEGATPGTHVRPLNQGSNPIADIGCVRALELAAAHLLPAVVEEGNTSARDGMMLASTVVGTAMGNAGTAAPHGLSYPVSAFSVEGDYIPGEGYPPAALLPHGQSVMMTAPSVFEHQAAADPHRHAQIAGLLSSAASQRGTPHASGASPAELAGLADSDPAAVGEILRTELVAIMRASGITPSGLAAIGVTNDHIPGFVERALPQKRVLDNAPFPVDAHNLTTIYQNSLSYW